MTGLPLSGVRVVEISHMVMGPSCGMILAQLGAEVIKVEPIGGDKTRYLKGMAISFFPLFNRGKKSVVLDLQATEGREAFLALLGTADVFLENFKDETVKALGLASEELSTRFPRLIIAAHKGFLSGPYEHRPALDEVVQMMSGLAYMTGSREVPLRVGASINDIMGGMFGVIGVLAALIARADHGRGAEVRIGLFENCLFAVAQHIAQFQMTGEPVSPMPQRIQAWPIYDIFTTADGQRIFIALTTDGHWRAFCKAFDLKSLLEDKDLETVSQRMAARERIVPIVAERLSQSDMTTLEQAFDRLSIPFSPINAPEELLDDPHVQRPGGLVDMILSDAQAIKVPSLPIEINGQNLTSPAVVPSLDGDSAEILEGIGYSVEDALKLASPSHASHLVRP